MGTVDGHFQMPRWNHTQYFKIFIDYIAVKFASCIFFWYQLNVVKEETL